MVDRSKLTRVMDLAQAPEQGPRVLLFSGGSAFHTLCRRLTSFTHNSIHLLTPFDSGGSSAVLRRAFAMPAVGDFRQRLMALADQSVPGVPAVYQLCDYRLPYSSSDLMLRRELAAMIAGDHPLTRVLPVEKSSVIARQLQSVLTRIPQDIDLRGASVGNLILTGGYLESDDDMVGTLCAFSELLSARGIVRPIVCEPAHLFAELQNGQVLKGQHELTGKEAPAIDSPVSKVTLSTCAEHFEPVNLEISDSNRALIKSAELICFAPGSFYSSLIATLLPAGVGGAIAASAVPKVFIPNLGVDPEQLGMNFEQSLSVLLNQMMQDADNVIPADLVSHVVVDTVNGVYPSEVNQAVLRDMGIELIDLPLVTSESSPYYDNNKVLQILLSLT